MKYLKLFFFSFSLLIALLPACKDKPQPYKVDQVTIDQLRACAQMITTITVDSCEYVVSPLIPSSNWEGSAATVGLNLIHKELCKNPKHGR